MKRVLSQTQSKSILDALIKESPVGIFYTDKDGMCLHVNQRLENMTGLSAEQMDGDGWSRALHPDDKERVYREWYAAAQGHTSYTTECRLVDPAGRCTWVLVQSSPDLDQDNNLVGHIGILTDITQQQVMIQTLHETTVSKQSLQQSEAMWRSLVENAPDFIMIVDRDLNFKYLNYVQDGYTIDDFIGKSAVSIMPPDQEKFAREIYQSVLATGKKETFEIKAPTGPDTFGWYHVTVGPLFDDDRVDSLIVISRDITELQHVKQDLLEKEAMMSVIIGNAVEGIISTDERGNIETVNQATLRLFGYSQDELIGKSIDMLVPDAQQGHHARYIAEYLDTGKSKIIGIGRETRGRRKDGQEFPVYVSISESVLTNRKVFTAIVHDISREKETRQQLREALIEAKSANLAKSRFLASMSHDIRTPLSVIRNIVQATQYDLKKNGLYDTYKSGLEVLEKASQNLLLTVSNALDISRIESGDIEQSKHVFSLYELVKEIRSICEKMAEEKHIHLKVNYDMSLPEDIYSDRRMINLILMNLISNAIKFTPEYKSVSVDALSEQNQLVFIVSDRGVGIPKEMIHTIYNPFAQAHTSQDDVNQGAGLGLWIVKNLVSQLDGRIRVQSEMGVGTTFTIRLPLEQVDKNVQTDFEQNMRPVQEEDYSVEYECKILIAEDERFVRFGLEQIFGSLALKVSFAVDGEDAIRKIKVLEPDIVFMDIHMPRLNGIEAIKQIRAMEKFRSLPIIVLSADAFTDRRDEVAELGITDYVIKPIDRKDIVDMLSKYVVHQAD